VDPDYRLGPGDEIVLILTGDVELAYTLDVTREGFIVIPDVGQVSVNGLTLRSLRDRLYDRLGQVYSGVRRGPDATTHFDVSLGRLRTNQVFVIGDVARPGAYQVSSVGTAMTALYAAGGPTEMGSFRSVSVIRDGEEISEVDLYDYLLRGDASRDVRLFQGDVVFVPPSDAQVRIQGQVRRPAIYEMKTGETLTDLIRFAGGFEPTAHVRRVQVDRILPPDQREPGRDRVLLDANVLALATGTGPDFPLLPGDRVTVSGVLDRQEGRVRIGGAVWRPGVYEYRPGMTVWDLIGEAEGLQPSAYQLTAHVHRLVEETGARRLLRVSLEKDAGGDLVQDLPLADLDSVRVFNTDSLRMPDSVAISGQVRESGTYLLDEGMTVQDLILTAGGFTRGAIGYEAEVVRLTEGLTRTDTLAVEYRVSVEGGIPHPLGDTVFRAPPEAGPYHARAADFVLQGTDHVFVRRLPGWVGRGSVQVSGEIAVPGRYAFEFRQERLSSFVRRAGGPTEQAYLPGARLVRDSVLVGIELEEALADPGGPEDVLLEQDDELVIPEYDPTVLVQGAVAFPTRVIYREGWGVDEYLSEAGGSTQDADMDRLSVRYQNGSRATTRDYKLFRNYPDVGPGTTIIVPAKAEDVTNWDRFNRILTQTLSTTATILTIVLTVDRLGG
jgi:protein involved in polysaccharide export with SLBB domain